jgi:hypothetical protein
MNRHAPAFLVVFCAALGACGSSTAGDAGAPDALAADSGLPLDAAQSVMDGGPSDSGLAQDSGQSSADSGSPADSGSSVPDSGSAADAGGSETTYMLNVGDCFTFATATSMAMNGMSCGDLFALSGANVDLETPGSGLCDLPGTFTSLASVPSSYASCVWSSYLEGLNGLTNHGVIVRDAAGAHHYRMRILSNAQPALVFSFAPID